MPLRDFNDFGGWTVFGYNGRVEHSALNCAVEPFILIER